MMQLLDLYCGAGGAGMGYARAGFAVTGVDIRPQPEYPLTFVQADALAYLEEHGHRFDVIHASPPCQPYSTAVTSRSSRYVPTLGKDEPALIAATVEALRDRGGLWIVENVAGARAEFQRLGLSPMLLCGAMFRLKIPRHRLFVTSWPAYGRRHPPCSGLAKRSAAELGWEWRDMSVTGKGRHAGTSDRWRQLLGIDWPATQRQLAEAIPPIYTEFIGRQITEPT